LHQGALNGIKTPPPLRLSTTTILVTLDPLDITIPVMTLVEVIVTLVTTLVEAIITTLDHRGTAVVEEDIIID
jgi:hypothetical protein